jgi:hypothetical protein
VRVLTHIKKLDDCFGDFLVRVVCVCGSCREIEPQALARLVGWKVALQELAPPLRCSRCGKKAVEVVACEASRLHGAILIRARERKTAHFCRGDRPYLIYQSPLDGGGRASPNINKVVVQLAR